MNTPLCDALRTFAATAPLRMHMPGHKGMGLPLPELSAAAPLDFTELPPTGNLFEGDGPIRAAEELWAAAFHMDACLFLTGGSTQGVLSALTLTCRPGDAVLLDRGCHRSAYNALALLDLQPHYLYRPWLEEEGIGGPVSPQAVEKELAEHPEIKTVCITSPTYYGVQSDISTLASVAHTHGARLIVDGAHGAHLPFLGDFSLSAADLAVVSAHKTLPAPGQSALLFANGVPLEELCRAGSLYGSSSPSSPMMAALDAARAWTRPAPPNGPHAGPHPPGALVPGRLCRQGGAGGAGRLSRDGGPAPCGVHLHRLRHRRIFPPPGGSPPRRPAPGHSPAPHHAPPCSPAGAGLLPPDRPLCPRGDGAAPPGGGAHRRRAGGPLPPRRARCGPWGATDEKNYRIFETNRL